MHTWMWIVAMNESHYVAMEKYILNHKKIYFTLYDWLNYKTILAYGSQSNINLFINPTYLKSAFV